MARLPHRVICRGLRGHVPPALPQRRRRRDIATDKLQHARKALGEFRVRGSFRYLILPQLDIPASKRFQIRRR
jgi:hypothetical protein